MSPFYRKVWSERQASKEKNYIFDCVARRIYVHLLQYHGRLSILTHRHLERLKQDYFALFQIAYILSGNIEDVDLSGMENAFVTPVPGT
jgi:hypothetical protein